MKKWTRIFPFFIILCSLVFIYRDVFIHQKIIFPSNFLAQFYSPWITQTFSGWNSGIPHKPIGTDQIRFFYPGRTFTNESIQNKTVPLWNPYNFAGSPFIADFQSGVFYPFNILYLFLPQITVWNFLIFIEPLLAFSFMYLYLSCLGLKKSAIFLGSIAFGFSGFMIVWGQENMVVPHAALWIPLIFFSIEKYIQKKNYIFLALLIVGLSSSFLAGFFQVTFYIYITAFCYALTRMYQDRSGKKFLPVISMLGAFIFSLGIVSIQLIPSIESFFESPRNSSSVWYLFETYLLPLTHIVNVISPDVFGNPGSYNFFGRGFYHETVLYIGVIPLLFALFSFTRKNKLRVEMFFIWSALISFFLTITSPITQFLFKLPIPLLSTFLPSRIFLITTFSLVALSAFGFSY